MNLLSNMTIVEIQDLQSEFTSSYGISMKIDITTGIAPLNYELILIDFNGAKLQTVKLVKEITDLGLKEAKELCEKTPCSIISTFNPKVQTVEKLREFLSLLQKLGAKCTIKPIITN